MLAIGELLHRRPRQLSGGQRQRVAMGRSIVREPQAFLMDEPLSNLDAKLRVEMRAAIARLHQQLRTTTIYVTHDQTEAMTMGDRVAVMKDGRLEQVDTPRELYERPANLFVGAFIGSPALNVVRATVAAENGGVVASFGTASLSVPERHPAAGPLRRRAGGDVVLGIRPEDIEDGGLTESSDERSFDADVSLAEPTGADVVAHFEVPGAVGPAGEPRPDLVARLNRRSSAASGERLRFVVDLDRLYFFDPDTHESLA